MPDSDKEGTLDTYGTYSLNGSSEESDIAISKNSYQNKKMRNESGSLKVGRFIIAKGG